MSEQTIYIFCSGVLVGIHIACVVFNLHRLRKIKQWLREGGREVSNYPYPWNTDAPGPGQSTRQPVGAKPEPKPKHDGNLSPDGGRVSYDWLVEHGIRIEGRYFDGYHDNAVLMPKEALSLLAWLEQERETLEQMAKEQAK